MSKPKKELTAEQKAQRAEKAREWRINNPDKNKKNIKRRKENNKEKIREQSKAWRDKNRERLRETARKYYHERYKTKARDSLLKRCFGITLEEYGKMLENQGDVCAICGGSPDAKGKEFAVDHDHNTGKIRALLCRGCNVGIGNLKDDPELLEKAAAYIRANREAGAVTETEKKTEIV